MNIKKDLIIKSIEKNIFTKMYKEQKYLLYLICNESIVDNYSNVNQNIHIQNSLIDNLAILETSLNKEEFHILMIEIIKFYLSIYSYIEGQYIEWLDYERNMGIYEDNGKIMYLYSPNNCNYFELFKILLDKLNNISYIQSDIMVSKRILGRILEI